MKFCGSDSLSLDDVLAPGGLFHCTRLRTLRVILKDGYLRPACQTGAPARGEGVESRTRRLGGVCLFDVLPEAEGGSVFHTNPGRAWTQGWLTAHQPVMTAVVLDRARLLAQGGVLLSEEQARRLVPGVTLVGEVCHVGEIALAECTRGFLFVRGGRRGTPPACDYVAGNQIVPVDIVRAVRRLRSARRTTVPDQFATTTLEPSPATSP